MLTFREQVKTKALFEVFCALLVVMGAVSVFTVGIYAGTWYHAMRVWLEYPLLSAIFWVSVFALISGMCVAGKVPRGEMLQVLSAVALFAAAFPLGYGLTFLLV